MSCDSFTRSRVGVRGRAVFSSPRSGSAVVMLDINKETAAERTRASPPFPGHSSASAVARSFLRPSLRRPSLPEPFSRRLSLVPFSPPALQPCRPSSQRLSQALQPLPALSLPRASRLSLPELPSPPVLARFSSRRQLVPALPSSLLPSRTLVFQSSKRRVGGRAHSLPAVIAAGHP